EPRDDVFARRDPDDPRRRIAGRKTPLDHLGDRPDDRAHRRPALVLDNNLIPGARLAIAVAIGRHERMRPADPRQLDGNQTGRIRRVTKGPYRCRTSQSATILTPALRSSASSARSTAANARRPRSPPNAFVSRSRIGRTSALAIIPVSARLASSSTSL